MWASNMVGLSFVQPLGLLRLVRLRNLGSWPSSTTSMILKVLLGLAKLCGKTKDGRRGGLCGTYSMRVSRLSTIGLGFRNNFNFHK